MAIIIQLNRLHTKQLWSNKMTDKQIIDVSKCGYYKELSNPNEDGDEYNDICECCITESAFCFDECNSNCYFKNWQRGEQKLERIKQYVKDNEWCLLDNTYTELLQIIEGKENG